MLKEKEFSLNVVASSSGGASAFGVSECSAWK
jgi:hypothetical protein